VTSAVADQAGVSESHPSGHQAMPDKTIRAIAQQVPHNREIYDLEIEGDTAIDLPTREWSVVLAGTSEQ
jgi:hypothetical protein